VDGFLHRQVFRAAPSNQFIKIQNKDFDLVSQQVMQEQQIGNLTTLEERNDIKLWNCTNSTNITYELLGSGSAAGIVNKSVLISNDTYYKLINPEVIFDPAYYSHNGTHGSWNVSLLNSS
jgi:hypothetical protein